MSWPLASFALVAAALAVGWFAYERSRPSARTVALVATLSALAALGRDAFAALDEVKPITAMTFVVGYCLGPLPGFIVGATGMLVSGMLLGQGPYTPWQMAAWGIVGLLGAATGSLSRKRLGRLPLALGCAFAAGVAKEIMNVYGWVMGASHAPAALLVEVGRGLPFDVVDVVSTLLFGLAFGPELARLLSRMRARTQVEWRPAGAAPAVALASLALAGTVGAPSARAADSRAMAYADGSAQPAMSRSSASTRAAALARGVAYLLSAQKADGGFGMRRGAPSTELYTAWTAVALAAAGRSPCTAAKDGDTLFDALRAGVGGLESGAGAIERTIIALHSCGLPAGWLGGRDLVARLMRFHEANGSFEGQVDHTTFAIFALRALGDRPADPLIGAAGRWLSAQQNGDGSFSFGERGDAGDIDDTAAALEGMVAAGQPSTRPLARAIAYLRHAENGDGGFPQQPGGESDVPSTAWAIQALVAARQRVAEVGRSPIVYLERLVRPDGSVSYAHGVQQTPVWVTAEALAALAKRPFPIGPPQAAGGAGSSGRLGYASGSGSPRRGRYLTTAGTTAGVGVMSAECVHVLSAMLAR